MRSHKLIQSLTLLFSLGTVAPALAGICDAHYRFDGNLADESGNGYHGQMIVAGGNPSVPNFVAGRHGQALQLNGENAMQAFLDLHPDNCPQMTVAAWVKIEPEPNQTIFGNAGGNHMLVSGAELSVRTTGKDLWADGSPIRVNGGWMFVAAVWDYVNETYRVHWRTRHKEDSIAGRKPAIGNSAIWIGANNDQLHFYARDLVIDEIRFIGRAMSVPEVLALRGESAAPRGSVNLAPATTTQATTAVTAPTSDLTIANAVPNTTRPLQTNELQISCETSADCPSGMYCAIEDMCHPDRHAPKKTLVGFQEIEASPDLTLAPLEESPDEPIENVNRGLPRAVGLPLIERVAGFESKRTVTVDLVDLFLKTIVVQETFNRPCSISIGDTLPDKSQSLSGCDRFELNPDTLDDANDIKVSMPWPTWIYPDTYPGGGVRSLRVCNNSNNNQRVKGLAIRTHAIGRDGSSDTITGEASDELPNCADWSGWTNCDSTRLATGFVVHYTVTTRGNGQITGLQLICRRIGFEGDS